MKRKKFLGFIFLIVSILLILFTFRDKISRKPSINTGQPTTTITSPITSITPNPSTSKVDDLTSGYKSVWITVRDSGKLFLLSNLENRLSSKDAATKNGCDHLVSGSFYDQNNKHLGLFISEGVLISEYRESSLLDGFFYITYDAKAVISLTPPASPRLALQSGPTLIKDGKYLNVKIANDENARRLILAKSKKGEIIFIVLYKPASPILGPKLSELPSILDDIQSKTNLKLQDALNLDGGGHSAFLTNTATLTEISPIGSFFCIKP